ncbi:hypothetical protein AB0N09_20870 [Streptomyces erythrochromogenes]|uniref:hypothetical protein n=1 Tax=Streptomyces erythrochromogenes TaxID=285574 RepID=UPI00343F1115
MIEGVRRVAGEAGFGGALERLAGHRRLDAAALARFAGVAGAEVTAVLRGGTPDGVLLRRLAPALGVRTADLFATAGVAVPDDLAPLDPSAGWDVPALVRRALALAPEQREALREFAKSLPEEEPARPAPPTPAHEDYPAGPGGALMRMARNRNLGWSATAKTFLLLTGRYWAASSYGRVGRGLTPLTPDLVADFSTVLGVPAGTLAAITGVAPLPVAVEPDPAVHGVAELVWDVRRLTADRFLQVLDLAERTPDGPGPGGQSAPGSHG